jgi:hypothetical protein
VLYLSRTRTRSVWSSTTVRDYVYLACGVYLICVVYMYQNTKVFSYEGTFESTFEGTRTFESTFESTRTFVRKYESTKVRKYESIYEGTYLFRAIVCMYVCIYLEVRNNILSHEYLSYDTKV